MSEEGSKGWGFFRRRVKHADPASTEPPTAPSPQEFRVTPEPVRVPFPEGGVAAHTILPARENTLNSPLQMVTVGLHDMEHFSFEEFTEAITPLLESQVGRDPDIVFPPHALRFLVLREEGVEERDCLFILPNLIRETYYSLLQSAGFRGSLQSEGYLLHDQDGKGNSYVFDEGGLHDIWAAKISFDQSERYRKNTLEPRFRTRGIGSR